MRNNAPEWTKKETEDMREFINAFPDEPLKTIAMHPLLEGKFPGRTVQAVYHKWRCMKGLRKRKRKQSPPSQRNDVLESFGVFLSTYVNKQVEERTCAYINDQVKKRTAEVIEENEQLKQLLRKLKRLREAAEEFKV